MWTFKQDTGQIIDPNGGIVATGYSGGDRGLHPEGINTPTFQASHNIGTIPQGTYTIGAPENSPHLGAFAMPLTPYPTNEMFGRSGFFIHGDNARMNHSASDGCIILAREYREQIWNSGDHVLQVIA